MEPRGSFDARYLAFLETVTQLRPRLHRYCSRMIGSVLDGEDLVQEVLFEAYRKLDRFDDSRSLAPWLFQIAHNRCIDFLRRRKVRTQAEAEAIADMPEFAPPHESHGHDVAKAVEYLVQLLPPRERACLLLKDVFGYSLDEVADFLGSTTGAVKAALNRGRAKLAAKLATAPHRTPLAVAENQEQNVTLREYVTRFNRRDWDGVRDLIRADARVLVADRFSGPISESPYFGNYERWPVSWRLALGRIDGEPAVITLIRGVDKWMPHSVVKVSLIGDRIAWITDYGHCEWVLAHARTITFEQPALHNEG
jgi:RNA polymerase sigma-70 factor (ECF subfamily)